MLIYNKYCHFQFFYFSSEFNYWPNDYFTDHFDTDHKYTDHSIYLLTNEYIYCPNELKFTAQVNIIYWPKNYKPIYSDEY